MNTALHRRDYGIDALRLFAMELVIVLHIVGVGGVLDATAGDEWKYGIALFIKAFSLCAINIFGLISGYVGYGRKFKPMNLFKLWLQVLFWSVLITLFFVLFQKRTFDVELIKITFFPISFRTYWYMTAYFITIVLSIFFNRAIERISIIHLIILEIVIVVICSVVLTNSGNNPVWLSILYIIGATLKKAKIKEKTNAVIGVLGYIICVFIVWIGAYFRNQVFFLENKHIWGIIGGRNDGLWPSSIMMLLAACFSLFVAINIQINNSILIRIAKRITPLVLSVYLIHVHPLVFDRITGGFAFIGSYSSIAIVFMILGFSFSILVCGLFLDYWRSLLFTSIEKNIVKQDYCSK